MLVDTKKFKELKKADGGSLGFVCAVAVKVLEADGLKNVATCGLNIYPNGIYMDFLLNYKLYFPLENLYDVQIDGEVINIYIKNELPIKINIEKQSDMIKVYNALKTHLDESDENIKLPDKPKTSWQDVKESWGDVKTTWNQCPLKDMSIKETAHNKKKDDDNVACCPKCGSTSLSANKKGFSLAKGAVGVATVGVYGAVAAGLGKNKVLVTCLKCGHQWKAGKK